MDKVIIAGPYNAVAKQKMIADLERDFEVVSIAGTEEFKQHLDAQYVVLRTIPLPADIIEQMPNLKMIQRWGAGVDIIAVDTASARGIPVANVAGENSQTVAELTVGLLLAVYRRIVTIDNALRQGQWIKSTIDKSCFMICDKAVGIVGLGCIGRCVASMLLAFGAKVQYYDPNISDDIRAFEREHPVRAVSLDELLRTSDIVSLHLPLTPENHYIISEKEIAEMKDGAVLLNVARGGLVNQAALYAALKSGKLLGAALDCYEQEPLPADSPLLELDNVVLSCHVGGNTADLALRLADRCPRNIRAYANGTLDEKYVVNRKAIHYHTGG